MRLLVFLAETSGHGRRCRPEVAGRHSECVLEMSQKSAGRCSWCGIYQRSETCKWHEEKSINLHKMIDRIHCNAVTKDFSFKTFYLTHFTLPM